jgi:hypothetical protein
VNIGEEEDPIELPRPVHPDNVPADTPGAPAPEPAREPVPVPEGVPA